MICCGFATKDMSIVYKTTVLELKKKTTKISRVKLYEETIYVYKTNHNSEIS